MLPLAGYAYGVSSDGNGGTNVALDQVATVTNLTASPSSGYVKAGATITFTITTSNAVTVSGAAPVPNLSNGGTATFDSADSTGTSLIFKSTVASGQDSNGVTITSVSNAGDVQDADDVPLDFSGATSQAAVGPTIDTTAPIVAITSAGGLTNQPTQTTRSRPARAGPGAGRRRTAPPTRPSGRRASPPTSRISLSRRTD